MCPKCVRHKQAPQTLGGIPVKKALLVATVSMVALGTAFGSTAASAGNWTGFYVGVNAGVPQSTTGWDKIVVPSDPGAGVPGKVFSISGTGFAGGAQVGYNMQDGIWVYGLEAGFDATDEGSSTGCLGGFGDYHATCSTRTSWKGEIAARVGGTVGPALLYVKGGGAFGDMHTKALGVESDLTVAGSYLPSTSTPFGYLFGFGAEVAFTDCVSAALEYDYTSLSTHATMLPAPGANLGIVEPFDVHVTQNTGTVMARLNFKIGG